METSTEAGPPACGKAPGRSSMIKATERTRVSTGLGMRSRRAVETRAAAVRSGSAMKSTGAIEVAAIDENSAMGGIGAVIEHDPVVMPIVSPVSPAPAEPAKKTNSEAEAKLNSRNPKIKSWIGIPARPDADGRAIDEPRIIFRYVNSVRFRGLDHNLLPLRVHLFLRVAL